jgi:hypothetical protein
MEINTAKAKDQSHVQAEDATTSANQSTTKNLTSGSTTGSVAGRNASVEWTGAR